MKDCFLEILSFFLLALFDFGLAFWLINSWVYFLASILGE